MPLAPNSAALAYLASQAGMPRLQLPDGRTLDQPHPEWLLHQLRWRWLLDSWEGGEAYRMAVYGFDIHGMPVRNLIRHKREYPSSFDANYAPQTGRPAGHRPGHPGDRRRLRAAAGAHAGAHVRGRGGRGPPGADLQPRGPPRRPRRGLQAWWRNVDGQGTIDRPVDVRHDRPAAAGSGPARHHHRPSARPRGRGDPQPGRRGPPGAGHLRGLVHPAREPDLVDARPAGRLSRVPGSRDPGRRPGLVAVLGRAVAGRSSTRRARSLAGPVEHPFGRVPIVRLFDRRRPRCRNIGLPRYESIAELQREYLQPRQRADPLGHHPGTPAASGPRGLRSGRRHRADRPELAAAQEEELERREHHLRGLRRRAVSQGRGRLDPPEQGRPARRRRPRGAAAEAGRARRLARDRPWPRAASPSGWTRLPATTC